jgi:hypothetical protein
VRGKVHGNGRRERGTSGVKVDVGEDGFQIEKK